MAQVQFTPVQEPVCIWTEASRKFAVYLQPDVFARLERESRLAFKSVRHRGLELGGILLGRAESRDGMTAFWIDGVQPVEYENEPYASPAAAGVALAHLEESVKKNVKAIGIYRSQTRSEKLALQDRDAALFEGCFRAKDALFLMLGSVSGMAALFIRSGGRLKVVHKLALGPRPVPAPADLPKPEPPLTYKQSFTGSILHAKNLTKTGGRRGLVAVIATLVFSVSGFAFFSRHMPSHTQKAAQSLLLTVERDGPSLRLFWDQASPALRGASRAVVHIKDGDRQSNRDLAPADFASGSINYEPRTSEVSFRMDVYSVNPNATGSVLAVNVAPQPATVRPTLAKANFNPALKK